MSSATAFTKLYSGILESTVWCEPDRTRLVWVTMLAMADQYGRVMGSVPGLANRARVPLEDARLAIKTFLAPDPDSRTKGFEGRRVDEIDGGWRLLNYEKYRELRSEDDRREQNRQAQARTREKKKAASSKVSTRQHTSAESAQAEAEEEAEEEKREPGAIAPSSPAMQATLPLPGLSVVPTPPPPRLPACPHGELIAMFIVAVPDMPRPRVEAWSGTKAKDMRARWDWVLTARRGGDGDRYASSSVEALAWFGRFFKVVAESDFLCGRAGSRSKFTLGWLMKKDNFDKVMDHGYSNREAA